MALIFFLQVTVAVTANSTLPVITDGGQTDELNKELIHWTVTNSGDVITVGADGNVSLNALNNGILSTQWTVFLSVNANSARVDNAGELIVVAHQTGVQVVQISSQSVFQTINTTNPVDDASFDHQGDLWIAQFAGKRMATEYDTNGLTGSTSPVITSGISAFEILSDGRLVLASYDKKIYVTSNSGDLLTTLTEPTAIIGSLEETSDGVLLAGSNGGTVHKYDTNSWATSSMSLSHGKQVVSMNHRGDFMFGIGAKQGEISFINSSTLAEIETYTGSGNVIGYLAEFTGQLYIAGTSPTWTRIHFYDLDSDLDGVNDLNDAFPNDNTQTTDSDDDGYGDDANGNNPDAFPNEATQWADLDGDGYGDNPIGVDGDLFPNNSDQWSDIDGDGYGDNRNGEAGDQFPEEATQWGDLDLDGYGDNADGYKPDSCPMLNGFSSADRYGCTDSDLDGYSDPDEDWTVLDGADALSEIGSQWQDQDSDGYGDSAQGSTPDACPWEYGLSTKAWVLDETSSIGYSEEPSYGCLDNDGDGWVDRTESPLMDIDPNEHFDADGDGVGSNSDYDDTRSFIQTEQDHCLTDKNDTSEACQGWNNPAFQAYLAGQNETGLNFFSWNASEQTDSSSTGALNVDDDTLFQVIKVGGIAFVCLTGLILLIAFMVNKRKGATAKKTYGDLSSSQTNQASMEALEGKGGISAQGGVISDSVWDDDVANFDFEDESNGFEDMELKDDSALPEAGAMTYDEESIEAIAGMPSPQQSTEKSIVEPEVSEESRPSEAPPLPEGGLPDGWTMDQWQWYGHEWLAKYGKN